MIRYWCDTTGCETEIPAMQMSREHTCSWCGAHSCMAHILVDAWNNSACVRCAKAKMIKVRRATERPGNEQRLGDDQQP